MARPASSRTTRFWLRSLKLVDHGLAAASVAFQFMRRNSSSGRYSRTRSNSVLAPATRTAYYRLRFESSAHHQVVPPQFSEVGVDADGLRRVALTESTTNETEGAVDADEQVAEGGVAAAGWPGVVGQGLLCIAQ